jgi:GNAT superfamily N-acetyltransferase
MFHSEKLSPRDLEEFLFVAHPEYPSFVMKENDRITGYCFITRYKNRQAYDRSAELSIYLLPEYTGKGIGPVALHHLEEAAKKPAFMSLSAPCAGKTMQVSGLSKCPVTPGVQPEKYRRKIWKNSGCRHVPERDLSSPGSRSAAETSWGRYLILISRGPGPRIRSAPSRSSPAMRLPVPAHARHDPRMTGPVHRAPGSLRSVPTGHPCARNGRSR